ncbi:MAG: LEA type 2 family protein [Steroidobacteraceae bacterium]|nr:LEA type 2 family protein [Steroidobacteraceae bacterium]
MNPVIATVPGSIVPRRRRSVCAAAACALGALLTSACAVFTPRFERPDLAVVRIEMRSGNLFQQNFLVTLRIHNPNSRPLPVERVRAHLLFAGVELASGVTMRPFIVPARGDTSFDMMISANLAAGFTQFAQRLGAHRDSIPYELDGAVRLDLPLFRSLRFHDHGELPLRTTP